MKMPRLIFTTTLLLILIVVSCNVLKKEDNDADVRKFVSAFYASLLLSDDAILKQFESNQSKESILSAIRVLQNKESEYIECAADFSNYSVLSKDGFITIQIHSTLISKNVEHEYTSEADIILKLKRKNRSYVIDELKGEEFYAAFAEMRNRMEWFVERAEAKKIRQPIYAKARELQQKFDTVIWYTRYQEVTYFYVVNGSWSDEHFKNNSGGYTMGVVDEQGNEIIPVAYEFIGTIGFSEENVVEVGTKGKIGLFDIKSRKVIVEPDYNSIIPFDKAGVRALAKRDSIYGWLDYDGKFSTGFPSEEAEHWIKSYGFVPANLKISHETQAVCEPAAEMFIGRGHVMPSTYLVNTGIFDRVIEGITTTSFPMQGWTDYVETKGSSVRNISENLNALITTITSRYLDGREEFYTQNRLVFINDKNDTLAVSGISTDKEMEIIRMDSSLIQIKSYSQWWGEPYPEDNGDLPDYTYFKIEGNSIKPLASTRLFKPSQFVKLDSTYLTGKFVWYDYERNDQRETTFLSKATITYFRNEILAEYGYRFPNPEDVEKFNTPRYQPRFNSIEEFRAQMTEVDKHNIDFLEQIINQMQEQAL
jgi:hypothetical protein